MAAVNKDVFWHLVKSLREIKYAAVSVPPVDKIINDAVLVAFTTTATDANATNLGMRSRALLSHGGQMVQTTIPLNRYSFFERLSDRLLPPMQLEFLITLQNDRELIYQSYGTARRIVVRKLELWVPQLHFTGKGQTFVNENFLKPTQWKYLKENIFF